MKKLFLFAFILVIGGIDYIHSENNSLNTLSIEKEEAFYGKKRINVTITSDEGCDVHIQGTVSYSLIPPQVTGFSGSVSISGGNCPDVTMTFSSMIVNNPETLPEVSNAPLVLELDTGNCGEINQARFIENNETAYFLNNSTKVSSTLVRELNSSCR